MVKILELISVVIQLIPSNSLSPVTALHGVICQWCVLIDSNSNACPYVIIIKKLIMLTVYSQLGMFHIPPLFLQLTWHQEGPVC